MKSYYGIRGERLQLAVSIIAGLDFLLFGYDQGVVGGLLNFPSFERQFPDISPGLHPPPDPENYQASIYQGTAVSAYNAGCFLGAIACIWLGNILGRRRTIFTGTSIMVIGAILQCSAYSLPHFIVGRIVTGMGNGLNTSTVPTWQSECTKSHRRGPLVMVEGALITCGIMISYWIDFGFYFIRENSIAWRFPIGFQLIFEVFILFTILGLPESPRWLILKGKDDEALEVLCALNDADENDKFVQNEFAAIKDTVLEESKGSFRDLFTMDENRHFHRAVLAYVNQMFQQISGINLITYYAATIYTNIGLTGYLPTLLAACNGTEYFLASWIPYFIIEKVGRRKLMLFGAVGMSLSMVVLAVTTSFTKDGVINGKIMKGPGIVASVFLFIFNTFFAIGWLGMTWLYPAEIVPLRIRAPANALSTSANWAFNFLIVMISPVSFAGVGYQTYIVFAVINAVAIVPATYLFFPETANRSLEEMDAIFHKATNVFNVVKIARDEPHRFDAKGEILIQYESTMEGRRRSSVIGGNTPKVPRVQGESDASSNEKNV